MDVPERIVDALEVVYIQSSKTKLDCRGSIGDALTLVSKSRQYFVDTHIESLAIQQSGQRIALVVIEQR